MLQMLIPIFIVVSSNTIYQICSKSIPQNLNAFASLAISYAVGAVCSLLLFFLTAEQKNLSSEIMKANWSSFALGAAIVGLEFGYICVYRAGWKISVGSLVANISLACMLLFVGMLLYKEMPSLRQLIGMGICIIGLILIAK